MLKIRYGDEYPESSFKEKSWDSEAKLFTLVDERANELTLKFAHEVRDDYLTDDYACFLFSSDLFSKESDIYQVYEKNLDDRIGWIFPIQSLNSTEHTYFDNPHFLRYAFVAFRKLITGDFENTIVVSKSFSNEMFTEEISITDIFSFNWIVLVLSKHKLESLRGFDINSYIPSFYLHGYYLLDQAKPFGKTSSLSLEAVRREKIFVQPVSENIKGKNYIEMLFKDLLVHESHPLVMFNLLYQIVELLIEEILEKEIVELLRQAAGKEKDYHELKEDFVSVSRESTRIAMLFGKVSFSHNIKTEFMAECNILLAKHSKSSSSIHDCLYKVRNLIVHKYRKILEEERNSEAISKINLYLQFIIVELLYQYES